MTDVPGSWRRLPFEEVIDFREGPGILARDFRTSGVPLIRLAGLTGRGSTLRGCNHLDPQMVERKWAHFAVRPGDTLLSTSASLGRVVRATSDAEGAIPYTGIIRMRPASDDLAPEFLPYLLESRDFQLQAEAVGAGSVMQHFGPSHLRTMTVVVPPIGEQRGIAATLGGLDDKIDSSRRTIDLLDQLAFALWRKASSTGSTRTPVSELIAARKLTIGDGYRAKNSELGSNGLPFVRAADLRDGFDLDIANRLGDDGIARAGDKVSRPGDVVFTSKGTVGRFAYVSQSTPPMVYSPQLCYWRSLDSDALPPEVVFYWLRGDEAMEQLNALKGQTDMADYVSLRDQRGMWMSLPAPTTVRQVTADLAALLQSAGFRRSEIGTLTALRDTLLPELLSGRIRVPEAREAVAETV